MVTLIGQPLNALDTPQLLIDLDTVDANLACMFAAARQRGVRVRTHFKSEEHAKVACANPAVRVGDRREVIPAHCCATMNLHRACVAVRQGLVEALWPIEASGRYD